VRCTKEVKYLYNVLTYFAPYRSPPRHMEDN
jgi:hypothetical protein